MSKANKIKRWTLRGRILQFLCATALIIALALSAAGVRFVTQAADREIDALLHEELDEVKAAFSLVTPTPEAFAEAFSEVAEELHKSHPGASFAWRLWPPDGCQRPREFGKLEELKPEAPACEPLDQSFKTGDGHRWRSTELANGYTVGLILDEEPHFALVREFGIVVLVFMLVGLAGIFIVGLSLANRVSSLLSKVAQEVRGISGPAEEVQLSKTKLPDEIREVVDALEGLLQRTREEANASRLLIAGVAHELRSPLQNLIGEAEVALLSERTPQDYQALLTSQLDELRELGDAIQNLVALCSTRQEAGGALERFCLQDELEFRLTREKQRAEREGLDLTLEFRGDTCLQGDREAILTGLRNLVSNAIDWTPRGGKIDLVCAGQGEDVLMTICDTGPGIPKKLIPHIFEPFVRGEAASGRRIGYGLGLALAHSAATAQGGTIEVVDVEGLGASFRIVLPRVPRPAARPAARLAALN